MPIYEFYCVACHRVFSFLSRTMSPSRRPACPRCGQPELEKRVSLFAVSKGRKEEPKADKEPALPPGMDESRLEAAMASLAQEAEGLDDEDPRQAARLMRRLFDATGMPVGGPMEEALRRMESGEDPDKVEEEMGDVLGDDPFGGALGGPADASGEPKKSLSRLRRALPPSVDPKLYELE